MPFLFKIINKIGIKLFYIPGNVPNIVRLMKKLAQFVLDMSKIVETYPAVS
jgi:hypothetical protein